MHKITVLPSVRFLAVLVLSLLIWIQPSAQAEKPLYDWVFSGEPGSEVPSVGQNHSGLRPVEVGGASLATRLQGSDADLGWQFVQPPAEQAGGLSAEIDTELLEFHVTVFCNLNDLQSSLNDEYLAGFEKKSFLRFTSANRLEAGILIPGEGWKEVGIGVAQITAWEHWMEISMGYAEGRLVLTVNGSEVASSVVGDTSLPGGSVFVVGAMPWGTNEGAFTGQIQRVILDDRSMPETSGN